MILILAILTVIEVYALHREVRERNEGKRAFWFAVMAICCITSLVIVR